MNTNEAPPVDQLLLPPTGSLAEEQPIGREAGRGHVGRLLNPLQRHTLRDSLAGHTLGAPRAAQRARPVVQRLQGGAGGPVIQMTKYGYVRLHSSERVVKREKVGNTLKIDKSKETEASEEEYQEYLAAFYGPQKGRKSSAPKVVRPVGLHTKKNRNRSGHTKLEEASDLRFRGMSVNNIKNLSDALKLGGEDGENTPIFTTQVPNGKASAEEHIVNDAEDSPYLSFEARSMEVSAGKYAAKPVDEDNRPIGVETREGGFLKQEKSYTLESRRQNNKRLGYVGGVLPTAGTQEDYSTPEAAKKLTDPKAQELAIADKEVLIKPGKEGVVKSQVPFVARVQEVSADYYKQYINKQTASLALGYHNGAYYKIQIDPASMAGYQFEVADELRLPEDDEGGMSDVEALDISPSSTKKGSTADSDPASSMSTGSGEKEKSGSEGKKRPEGNPHAEWASRRISRLIGQSTAIAALEGAVDPTAEDLRAMTEAVSSPNVKRASSKGGEPKKELSKKERRKLAYVSEANWTIEDFGGGGDCLFLSLNGDTDRRDAQRLRARIVHYQRENGLIGQGNVDAELGGMLDNSPHAALSGLGVATIGRQNIPIEAYYELMRVQGTWGGRAEVSAYTAMTGEDVYVIESTGSVTRYRRGAGQEVSGLPGDVPKEGHMVLYKTNNHWRRVMGRKE